MSVLLFKKPRDESKYRSWLRGHLNDGYVANRWREEVTVMFHRADCYTLTSNSYRHTTSDYPKICGTDFQTVRTSAKKEWHAETEMKCSRCNPE